MQGIDPPYATYGSPSPKHTVYYLCNCTLQYILMIIEVLVCIRRLYSLHSLKGFFKQRRQIGKDSFTVNKAYTIYIHSYLSFAAYSFFENRKNNVKIVFFSYFQCIFMILQKKHQRIFMLIIISFTLLQSVLLEIMNQWDTM